VVETPGRGIGVSTREESGVERSLVSRDVAQMSHMNCPPILPALSSTTTRVSGSNSRPRGYQPPFQPSDRSMRPETSGDRRSRSVSVFPCEHWLQMRTAKALAGVQSDRSRPGMRARGPLRFSGSASHPFRGFDTAYDTLRRSTRRVAGRRGAELRSRERRGGTAVGSNVRPLVVVRLPTTDGLGRSQMAQRYAVSSRDEAEADLAHRYLAHVCVSARRS
jgi:hypothetical protein